MSGIVESLLQLADVRGAKRIEVEPVDTQPLVDEALRRLEMSIQQHKVVVRQPESWPLVIGYSAWLEEVWFNYLSNAIKYGGQPPVLEIGYNLLPESMFCFWVKDNGHGFNQDDAEYIFMPHARLVRGNFIAGHGLGCRLYGVLSSGWADRWEHRAKWGRVASSGLHCLPIQKPIWKSSVIPCQ